MSDDAYIKVTAVGASASPIQEQFDKLTAERDAAVRELNAIRGEHTPGEAYTLANPRPSLAGLVAENLAGCRAENEQLRTKLDIATKELLYINNCSGTQIQDACHACRTDNERLRAELEAERGIVRDERKRSDELSKAYDLLHRRIEAYDETHAYLAELREAALEAVHQETVYTGPDGLTLVREPHIEALAAVLAKVTP